MTAEREWEKESEQWSSDSQSCRWSCLRGWPWPWLWWGGSTWDRTHINVWPGPLGQPTLGACGPCQPRPPPGASPSPPGASGQSGWLGKKQTGKHIDFFLEENWKTKKEKKKGKKKASGRLVLRLTQVCRVMEESSEWDGNRERPSGWFSLGGINVTHNLTNLTKRATTPCYSQWKFTHYQRKLCLTGGEEITRKTADVIIFCW